MADLRRLEEIDGRNWEDLLGAPVTVLQIFVDGERYKSFARGGIDRLLNRPRQVAANA